MKWNKVTTRPLDEEEKELYPEGTFMWNGSIPEIDEEVLVTDGKDVWTDTWIEIGYDSCAFENTDMEEFYWMSFPEPPNEVK